MLRTAFRSHQLHHALSRPHQRTLTSSVLLTRTWENESVVELRREAKNRGLSAKGNKSTLITRIQQHEKSTTLDAVASRDPPVPAGKTAGYIRQASTIPTSVSPGIPPASQPNTPVPEPFTNIYLPDISQPEPESPVQIPFYPDNWESEQKKLEAAPEIPVSDLPKIVVIAGASTHHGGGPSHNLSSDHEAHAYSEVTVETAQQGKGGFFRDIAEDLGLPTSLGAEKQKARELIESLPDTIGSPSTESKTHSRDLHKDEVRGIWAVVGLLTGTWIVGGIVNRAPAEEEDVHGH